jgi:2-polyprenyl-6-methoxyphenol hydroxylase-like FAD-dependent oxidoreductase
MQGLPLPGRFHGSHAIVAGASIGGLLAARVLSSHFERVTLFDRDTLPEGIENRRGVPQGRHGHGLLASGLRGLQALFPELERDLLREGAVPGDAIGNVRWFQHGRYKAKFTSGLQGLLLSRPLLEVTLRRHVEELPNVRIVDNSRVRGLIGGCGRVNGVRVQQTGTEPFSVIGDFVVDATGRGSRSPEWLDELGYVRPPVDEVHVGIGYTTRIYRRRPTDLNGDIGAIIAPTPPREKRIGFMLAIEGDRWIVSLGGWLGNHCSPQPERYLEFSRTLARPDIYDVIRCAEPLTDAVTFGFPSNLRRRYDRLTRFPDNYLVIGDAQASFNPLYGHGMSVATLEALALRDCLEKAASCHDVWRAFFKASRDIIAAPWMIAAGSDFAFEGITGPQAPGTGVINWYLDRVHKAASTDRRVCRAFFDVANLLAPPHSLFRPTVITRVARACLLPTRSPGPAGSRDTERLGLAETH